MPNIYISFEIPFYSVFGGMHRVGQDDELDVPSTVSNTTSIVKGCLKMIMHPWSFIFH